MVFRESKGGGNSLSQQSKKERLQKKIDCQFIAYQGRGHKNGT